MRVISELQPLHHRGGLSQSITYRLVHEGLYSASRFSYVYTVRDYGVVGKSVVWNERGVTIGGILRIIRNGTTWRRHLGVQLSYGH